MSSDDTFPFQDRPFPERLILSALVLTLTFGVPWLAAVSLAKLAVRLFA